MNKLGSYMLYFIYFMLLEIIFRFAVYENALTKDFLTIILFTIPLAFLFAFLTKLSKNEGVNRAVNIFLIVLTLLIYSAQIIYIDIYSGLFSFESIFSLGQVTMFANRISEVFLRNHIFIVGNLALASLVTFTFQKFISFKKTKGEINFNILSFTAAVVLFNLSLIQLDKEKPVSLHSLYTMSNSSYLVGKKFGMYPGMFIELKKDLFGTKAYAKIKKQKFDHKIKDYNETKINFKGLIKNEVNENIINIHQYFQNKKPTSKNKYTGIFKDKNVIFILAESFDYAAFSEDLTPNLNKLFKEGLNFTNFYTPLFPLSTSDSEYMYNTSLLPIDGNWSMRNSGSKYFPYSLANILNKDDYKSFAYHDYNGAFYNRNETHKNLGFDFKACYSGLDMDCSKWPASDYEMIKSSYKEYMNADKFLTYYITVSAHLEHNKYNSMCLKNYHKVKNLKFSEKIKCFIAQNIELDKAVGKLINELKVSNKLKDTVIILGSDHYPYGIEEDILNENTKFNKYDKFDLHKTPFVIYSADIKPVKVDKLASNLDFLPTLLNMMGVKFDSRLLMGKDIFSNEESYVILPDHSFLTEKGFYDSATSLFSEKIVGAELDNMIREVENKFIISEHIYNNNYYEIIID